MMGDGQSHSTSKGSAGVEHRSPCVICNHCRKMSQHTPRVGVGIQWGYQKASWKEKRCQSKDIPSFWDGSTKLGAVGVAEAGGNGGHHGWYERNEAILKLNYMWAKLFRKVGFLYLRIKARTIGQLRYGLQAIYYSK